MAPHCNEQPRVKPRAALQTLLLLTQLLIHPFPSTDLQCTNPQMTGNSSYSYGDFAEGVDFAHWWSCIGIGLF